MDTSLRQLRAMLVTACCLLTLSAWPQADSLTIGFKTPPHWARPQVWWHWIGGNISKQGIRNDLLWMKRAGISGVHIFEAGLNSPQLVKERVRFGSEEWNSCLDYAVGLADSLGLDVALTSAPGWTHTGGPWVEPQDAMKKFVWREMIIDGGRRVKAPLPEPFTISGPFQNLPVDVKTYAAASFKPVSDYYRDICVLAIPMSADDLTMKEMGAKVTSSGGHFTLEQLTDGDVAHAEALPANTAKGFQWIQIEFAKPYTIEALSISGGKLWLRGTVNEPRATRFLEASDDGRTFRRVCRIPISQSPLLTMNIPATTARYFRICFENQSEPIEVSELCLYNVNKVEHAQDKAGFGVPPNINKYITRSGDKQPRLSEIIDLTDKVDASGMLHWRAPKGRWRILRFGYSLFGARNFPAQPEALGLEVDKLDSAAAARYMDGLLKVYRNAVASSIGNGRVSGLMFDSYEPGLATWTALMPEKFRHRCGYDLLPWMPALAGVIVESPEQTERFLFDWRKTLADLIAESIYKVGSEVAHANGMKTFMEAHELARVFLADGMDVKKNADVPMGAMWTDPRILLFNDNALRGRQGDIHESASTANLYGRRRVAAESMSADGKMDGGYAYSFYPGILKRVIDLEFANGLNQVVIHESAHQPVEDKLPGMSMGPWGQWFNRFETWAERARPWTDYLARTSYMLSLGRPVVDVLWYYPEDTNISACFNNQFPAVPPSNSYDYINSSALVDLLDYDGSQLRVPSGMTYRLLVLDPSATAITVKTLRKIDSLVRKGAPLLANRPKTCPSLADSKQEWEALVADIWDSNRSNVYVGKQVKDVLVGLGVRPDFAADSMDSLRFLHRSLPGAEIYWVTSRSFRPQRFTARFNVQGLKPMLWHPETGSKEEISYRVDDCGASAELYLQSGEAVFIVFKDSIGHHPIQELPHDTLTEMMNIGGEWSIQFQEGRGAPERITTTELKSYTEYEDPRIRYFGGTAVYSNSFRLQKKAKNSERIVLDLGSVYYMVNVKVNGHDFGTLWHAPFQIDITDALKAGDNHLEIEVTSLWRNRIIGDRQPDCQLPVTYTSYPFYNATSRLIPAGLAGPVRLLVRQPTTANEIP